MNEKMIIEDINDMLLPYRNGSYKDDVAGFHAKLFETYNSILKGYSGKTTTVILHMIKKGKTTALINMFLKELAEVFTMGRKVDFSNYALVIDAETATRKNDVDNFNVRMDSKTAVSMNNTEEYLHLLNTVGLENTIYAIYLLDKITHYRK
jgi:hypothetical protein